MSIEATDALERLENELSSKVLGQKDLIRGLLIGLVANGHVLIEGVPGLGKTRAVNLLARSTHLSFKRLQFTPDLLPADILGTRIYNQHVAEFETVTGPIFANFVLADEINRAPAKVQSALLETMQERQVTIGKESLPVPRPFLVFATQNPIEQEGTYPLPEAQLDRFLLKLVVRYPSRKNEEKIVDLVLGETRFPEPEPVLDAAGIEELQAAAREVYLEQRLVRYATSLVAATRRPADAGLELERYIEIGASPRGSIALALAAKALALIEGRNAVRPEHVKEVAPMVLRHRIVPTYYAEAERVTADQMIEQVLKAVPVP